MRYISQPYPVHDAAEKATGNALYAGDMKLHGMAEMALAFADRGAARITHIEKAEALALPGVIAVMDGGNTTQRRFNRYRTTSMQALPDEECLFTLEPRFCGDRVAAVIAEDAATARRAARLLRFTYEPLPEQALETADVHVQNGAYTRESGDVTVVTHTKLDRLCHVAMETHACVADYDAYDGQLTIYSPCQSVFGIRTVVADLLEQPYAKVRVVKTVMGGSFGGKQEWVLEAVTAAAALQVKRPVRLVFSREETMLSTYCRAPLSAALTAAFRPDGTLVSIQANVELDAGGYMSNSKDYLTAMGGRFYRSYRYAHLDFRGRAFCSNNPVSGAYRAWASPEAALMIEHTMEAAARKLKLDPLALRLQNAVRQGDVDPLSGVSLGATRLAQCLERGRTLFDYDARKASAAEARKGKGRYKTGVGVACGSHANGYYPKRADFARAAMHVNEDGSLELCASLHDHGCGTVRAMQLIAAECLELDPAAIRISEADTARTPFDVGCYASRTTFVLGRAVELCARALVTRLIEVAAAYWQVEKEAVVYRAGRCEHIAGGRTLSLGELARYSLFTLQRELRVEAEHASASNPGVHGAHFAAVEVDTYTGLVRVTDYLAVHDIGRTINRALCVSQLRGAIQMGIGAALSEHLDLHARNNRGGSLKNYHVVNACAMPDAQVEFIEDGDTEGPFGAKSIGEVAYAPVAAAVVAAVNEALQSDLWNLPLTPDKILAWKQETERE